MPVKGGRAIKSRMRQLIDEIQGSLTDDVVLECLIIGEGHAAAMTPVVSGNLVNSRYRALRYFTGGTQGRLVYTANYAAYVHDSPGTLAGTPRPKKQGGNYWDPDGEPQFLRKGFEEEPALSDIKAHINRRYRK